MSEALDFGTPETDAQANAEWPQGVAVFLDRDGVINENRVDHVYTWDKVRFVPGSLAALRRLAQTPWRIVVVTNQSGVNRGVFSGAQVDDLHQRMQAAIAVEGGRVDAWYFCPHRPDEPCDCRKPKPGLLRRAAQAWGLTLARSYLVGDNVSDLGAAWAVGAQAILVRTGLGEKFAARLTEAQRAQCVVCDDLAHAVAWICARAGVAPDTPDTAGRAAAGWAPGEAVGR